MFNTQDTKERLVRTITPDYDKLGKEEKKKAREKAEQVIKQSGNSERKSFR